MIQRAALNMSELKARPGPTATWRSGGGCGGVLFTVITTANGSIVVSMLNQASMALSPLPTS